MSHVIGKLEKKISQFIKVGGMVHPTEYGERFRRELVNAGEYFLSVGLAKKVNDGPFYWEPLPALPNILHKAIANGNWKVLLKHKSDPVSDEVITHIAVFLGYMFCFEQLDQITTC